ncbi:hypothetical protein DPMN_174715 [Dreissena polymorpha]|uniref:Proline-rich transmembrane protein 3/4 domain-containing protein n=1 Tax=Dreissena polymorpha TaxID=45954 RepID=A0A9D4E549_DREPO|nr:hypothetical protein DPMN_174715 [Dreissena polymorpha]
MEQFSVGGEPEVISELGSLVKGEPEAEVISEPEANVTSESEAEVTSEPEAEVTSEPEAEVTTEPEPESHTTAAESRPEPEVEGNAEAEGTHNPEPEGQESSLAEAEPNWPEAFKEWGPAWHLHVYMFASLFLSIAIVTCASMTFYLRDRQRLRQGILTFTLQCLLLTFTLLRSLSLFINPYQTVHGNDSPGLVFMWTFALPGLTASYSVLLLVFLDTTKMTLGPPMFQRLSVLLGITAAHFVVVMTSDIVCFFESSACKPMLMFCQCLFILYGLLLGVGYLYTAIVVTKKCSSEVLHGKSSFE